MLPIISNRCRFPTRVVNDLVTGSGTYYSPAICHYQYHTVAHLCLALEAGTRGAPTIYDATKFCTVLDISSKP